MLEEPFHTKGNCHVNGEFEVYRVVMGEVVFVQTSRDLKEATITLAREGDMFNVTPFYFHRAVNPSKMTPLVTSDIRPLNTETSYSPIDEKGFPINVLRDEKGGLFMRKTKSEISSLDKDAPGVERPVHHSHITIKRSFVDKIIEDAKRGGLKLGESLDPSNYIVSNIRKVSDMKDFFINSDLAAKSDEIAYITLDGKLEEVNMINGLTIVLPGAIPV
jgi:hypothetical protein